MSSERAPLRVLLVAAALALCGAPAITQERADTDAAPHARLSSAEFAGPEACAECHPRQYHEWRGSAHAYSLVDPIFRACNAYAQRITGGAIGNGCIDCHSPVGARSGELPPAFDSLDGQSRAVTAGVSCEICHRMRAPPEGAPVGGASFRLAPAGTVSGPLPNPRSTSAHDSSQGEFISDSAHCGTCHDVIHNGRTLEKSFQEWADSLHRERDHRCQDCHMLRYSGEAATSGPFRHTLRRHGFPGASVPLVSFPNRGLQEESVRELLRTAARMTVLAPRRAAAGGELPLSVLVKNAGAGHRFPTGLSSFRQLWLEVTVKDREGDVVFRSGHLDSRGDLMNEWSEVAPGGDPALVSYTDRFVAADGTRVRFFFEAARVEEHSLAPLEERVELYRIPVPPGLLGSAVRARVRLLFRSYPPHGLRFLDLDHLTRELSIVVIDSFTTDWIEVGEIGLGPAVVRVPGDHSTIQEAIDAAADGDRVLVGPGVHELLAPLDFRGKSVVVESADGPGETSLRLAESARSAAGASVVVFRGGEGPDTRLEGFTVSGGRGTLEDGLRRGGGIYCRRSSPTVKRCFIVACSAAGGVGGGIACDGARPTFIACEVRDCVASFGGAVAVRVESEDPWSLAGLELQGNVAERGGGVYVEAGARLTLSRLTIAGSLAREDGAAVWVADGARVALEHCTLVHNAVVPARAADPVPAGRGALRGDPSSPPEIARSIVWSSVPGPGDGAFRDTLVDADVPGVGNRAELPLFRDASGEWIRIRRRDSSSGPPGMRQRWVGGDYRLLPGSAAIDRAGAEFPPDPDDSPADLGAHWLEQPLEVFVRGDVDLDGDVDASDVRVFVRYFTARAELACADAADVDDGGAVDLLDLVALAVQVATGLLPPAPPFPRCGLDPTYGEGVSCARSAAPCEHEPRSSSAAASDLPGKRIGGAARSE